MSVPNFREVQWNVGLVKGSKKKVSRGFSVQLAMPDMSTEQLKDLYAKRGVDSWILRIRKSTPTLLVLISTLPSGLVM